MTASWPDDYSSTWDGNPENWMSQVDGRVQLRDLSIPGTHDSVSKYGACPHNISTTQYATITEQLDAGIRFLDLRIKTDGDQGLRMVHGSDTISDYYAGSGSLTFKTVLEKIYEWMNIKIHQKETVIIKVVDCDYDGINTENDDYDTDERVCVIWQAVDDASDIKRLAFNKSLKTEDFVELTLDQARGELILWRAFKWKTKTIISGIYEEFGLNIYNAKRVEFDNSPRYQVGAPSSHILGGEIVVVDWQSLYTWKWSSPKYLSYGDKMNAVMKLMYDTWRGHTLGVLPQANQSYSVNELNIAVSDGQDSDFSRYYPITNATAMNPLFQNLLVHLMDTVNKPNNFSTFSASSPGSIGIVLFDWAEDPKNTQRKYQETKEFNEPIYRQVIKMNFVRSCMFDPDRVRYLPTNDALFAILQTLDINGKWVSVNGI